MRIAYYHKQGYLVGSAYKYYAFMQRHFGGDIVSDFKDDGYDVVVVRGDRKRDWKDVRRLGIPYILVEHDSASMREGNILGYERERLACARSAIFNTDHIVQHYKNLRYPIPFYITVALRPTIEDVVIDPLPKRKGKHLVYCGGIVPWHRRTSVVGYRAYNHIFGKFLEAGWDVHIYPAYEYDHRDYEEMGCIVHAHMPYKQLLREISQYTAGFIGYNSIDVPEAAFAYTRICQPNKTWDYLAAGIPTVGYQCDHAATIFDGKWGVVVPSLDLDTLRNIEFPAFNMETRISETMDADMPQFARVLRHAVGL